MFELEKELIDIINNLFDDYKDQWEEPFAEVDFCDYAQEEIQTKYGDKFDDYSITSYALERFGEEFENGIS